MKNLITDAVNHKFAPVVLGAMSAKYLVLLILRIIGRLSWFNIAHTAIFYVAYALVTVAYFCDRESLVKQYMLYAVNIIVAIDIVCNNIFSIAPFAVITALVGLYEREHISERNVFPKLLITNAVTVEILSILYLIGYVNPLYYMTAYISNFVPDVVLVVVVIFAGLFNGEKYEPFKRVYRAIIKCLPLAFSMLSMVFLIVVLVVLNMQPGYVSLGQALDSGEEVFIESAQNEGMCITSYDGEPVMGYSSYDSSQRFHFVPTAIEETYLIQDANDNMLTVVDTAGMNHVENMDRCTLEEAETITSAKGNQVWIPVEVDNTYVTFETYNGSYYLANVTYMSENSEVSRILATDSIDDATDGYFYLRDTALYDNEFYSWCQNATNVYQTAVMLAMSVVCLIITVFMMHQDKMGWKRDLEWVQL